MCKGCDYNLNELSLLCLDQQRCLDFCASHRLLRMSCTCTSCGRLINVNTDSQVFKCHRRVDIRKNKKVIKKRCSFSQSVRKGTWFQQSKLPISAILGITYDWLYGVNVEQCKHERRVSLGTVVDWYAFCREVAVDYCLKNKTMLGGDGCVVEIDVAKFGKKKYKNGRLMDGQWVLGGVERGTDEMFFVPVDDRREETLLPVIAEWVKPGSVICTDTYKSFNKLKDLGYTHRAVSRSKNEDDSDDLATRAHTRTMEQTWKYLRTFIPKAGGSDNHFSGYLAAALFCRKYPSQGSRFHSFLEAVSNAFPLESGKYHHICFAYKVNVHGYIS